MRPRRIRFASLSALAGGLLLSPPLSAQTTELRGVVVDDAGRPFAGLEVVLHRVTADGGAAVATATTAEDGRFRLPLEPGEDAVYFAATRFQDLLHVGAPFRLPVPEDADYVIVVGEQGTALGPARPGARAGSQPPPGPAWWAWILVPGTVALLFAGLWWRGARGPRRWRRLLVRLAELEARRGRAAAGAPDPDAGERKAIRARLRALAAASSRAVR